MNYSRQINRARGFTLIEAMIAMVIAAMVGLGTIGAIIYTRQSMELDKQTIAAMNFCRQMMEHVSRENPQAYAGQRTLVPFNAPGVEIEAIIYVDYFRINKTTGEVDWNNPQLAPTNVEPFFARVRVNWESTGRWSRERQVSMSTIVSSGI